MISRMADFTSRGQIDFDELLENHPEIKALYDKLLVDIRVSNWINGCYYELFVI